MSINPSTGRRVDGNWRSGLTLRPVRGAGRTISQHFASQTILMRNLLRVRFGNVVSSNSIWGNPSPRYRLRGSIGRPGSTSQQQICPCGR